MNIVLTYEDVCFLLEHMPAMNQVNNMPRYTALVALIENQKDAHLSGMVTNPEMAANAKTKIPTALEMMKEVAESKLAAIKEKLEQDQLDKGFNAVPNQHADAWNVLAETLTGNQGPVSIGVDPGVENGHTYTVVENGKLVEKPALPSPGPVDLSKGTMFLLPQKPAVKKEKSKSPADDSFKALLAEFKPKIPSLYGKSVIESAVESTFKKTGGYKKLAEDLMACGATVMSTISIHGVNPNPILKLKEIPLNGVLIAIKLVMRLCPDIGLKDAKDMAQDAYDNGNELEFATHNLPNNLKGFGAKLHGFTFEFCN